MTDKIPCVEDCRINGRDWTPDESMPRSEAAAMAAMCRSCPLIRECHREAVANLPETHGIWAGMLWQHGRAINLLPDAPRKRSLYQGVVWDSSRSQFKAFGQIPKTDTEPRQHFHLGYSDSETRAALIARAWRIKHGQAA